MRLTSPTSSIIPVNISLDYSYICDVKIEINRGSLMKYPGTNSYLYLG
jgi:hypothetical protein